MQKYLFGMRVQEEIKNDKTAHERQQNHNGGYQDDSINTSSLSSNRTNNFNSNNRLNKNVPNQIIVVVFLFVDVIDWLDIMIWCVLDLKIKISFVLKHNWRILQTIILPGLRLSLFS